MQLCYWTITDFNDCVRAVIGDDEKRHAGVVNRRTGWMKHGCIQAGGMMSTSTAHGDKVAREQSPRLITSVLSSNLSRFGTAILLASRI